MIPFRLRVDPSAHDRARVGPRRAHALVAAPARRLAAARLRRHERGRDRLPRGGSAGRGPPRVRADVRRALRAGHPHRDRVGLASLYYYVLTAACLLLGFAGLAFSEPLSRWLSPRWLVSSVAVAWLVTVVRFLLEKSAAPALLVQVLGVTWLAPVAGAYFATGLPAARPAAKPLVRALLGYAFLVRGFVALVGVVATHFGLGSHYDVSAVTSVPVALTGDVYGFVPGSWRQALWLTLVPQLVFWPAFTVLAGMLGATLAGVLFRQAKAVPRPRE